MDNAPWGESIEISLDRLERAIKDDGIWDTFNAASVWWAYTHHPSLRMTQRAANEAWRKKEPPFAPVPYQELLRRWKEARRGLAERCNG